MKKNKVFGFRIVRIKHDRKISGILRRNGISIPNRIVNKEGLKYFQMTSLSKKRLDKAIVILQNENLIKEREG